MLSPLLGCTLTGPFAPASAAFAATIASLRYQAEVLGIEVVNTLQSSESTWLDYQFSVPGLDPVTCTVRGWANEDNLAASESTVQAAVGLMSVHGRASGNAQALGVDYVSTLTASLALTGAIATAVGRLRGGNVSECKVSMASAGLLAVSQYLAGATAPDAPESLLPGSTCAVLRPPFTSSDGIVFELETLDAGPWRSFWTGMHVPLEDIAKGWHGFLMRYAKAVSPIPDTLCLALAQRPYAEIVTRCRQSALSICPVRTLEQRLDERLQASGPWTFALSAVSTPFRPCTSELPLSGLRVVESCRRIQGPLAGHLLSLLGAEVVRLELPGGDPLRGMAPLADGCSVRFDALNCHKQVVEVDIKSAAGRCAVLQQVREADVFVHNWAPGKAEELRLGETDLAAANPPLIYAYAGGWGPQGHPDGLPGTDFMVQAWSGVAAMIARASATAGGSLFTVLDVLGGIVSAQGIVAALLARQLSGHAGRVDSSLLGCADLLMHKPTDKGQFGGVFATARGLLAIECCEPSHLEQLAFGLGYSPSAVGAEHERLLREQLLTRTASEWQTMLQARGIPAATVVEDLLDVTCNSRFQTCLSARAYTRVNSPWSFT
ncbi:CoA transferase [Pseudomonas sp. MAFF 302030]|uniref:CoA transferase n=1 Tax=Pseudomonas morbosilactucae TaxID=2938197 RepID=A0A9X1YUZ8_9PSED|nr:CoA transferase [Pseudomonas morbosilactucae]MCK9798086.1 CoA transferase [Pseudomonas morbosilactucae]